MPTIKPVEGSWAEGSTQSRHWGLAVAVGVLVGALAAFGSIETAWAFSAFTVLVYYAITDLAALRLPEEQRPYPQWVAATGLTACLFLAFWVPAPIWGAGLGLILLGLLWKRFAARPGAGIGRAIGK